MRRKCATLNWWNDAVWEIIISEGWNPSEQSPELLKKLGPCKMFSLHRSKILSSINDMDMLTCGLNSGPSRVLTKSLMNCSLYAKASYYQHLRPLLAYLWLKIWTKQNIWRLDISVDDPTLVAFVKIMKPSCCVNCHLVSDWPLYKLGIWS